MLHLAGCEINLHENLVSQALQKAQGVQRPLRLPCLLALRFVLVHQGPPKNESNNRSEKEKSDYGQIVRRQILND